MSDNTVLDYDIVLYILSHLRNDYPSLHSCALVNHVFYNAAAKLLYRQVVYSPAPSRVLDLRRREEFIGGIYASSRLPHHAGHVLKLEIGGYLSTRPLHMTRLATNILDGVRAYHNLHTIVFAPKQYDENLFTDIIPLLHSCASLQDLTVGPACTNALCTPALVQIENLERLAIQSPTRAILQRLPEWLGRLSSTLRVFHLQDNCGSVTPGVLRSLAPALQRIRAFGLGLSYSLTDNDVFAFLNQLPRLSALELRYYLQFRPPTVRLRLPALRSLAVAHTPVPTREDVAYLVKWLRRILKTAPIEVLRLRCEDAGPGPSVSFDGLLAHLASTHAETLRVLRMDEAFVGRRAFEEMCERCERLEEVAVAVSAREMDALPDVVSNLGRLTVVRIALRNARRGRGRVDEDGVRALFQRATSLRQVTVDGATWEVGKVLVFFFPSSLHIVGQVGNHIGEGGAIRR
ncbi:hypothetical protein OBBRIDRAFT_855495 [Obba rivulosa]|uniref:F-box domain-containing protein n=1 Tax=Obba rivulosa TaxID=1052685 RepID=A0A8E2AQQ8_9APHY|nr:hypothetical protein OBBRIDRAFT_855495 [Obba rivulosa]